MLVLVALFGVLSEPIYADQMNNRDGANAALNNLDLRLTPDILNPDSPAKKPDFSGTWVLDSGASDDPEEVLKRAQKNEKDTQNKDSRDRGVRRPGGRPGGGPGRPEGIGPGGRGDDGNAGNKQGVKSIIKELKLKHMIIKHKEPVFELTISGIEPRMIYTDYRYFSVNPLGEDYQVTATAGWEDDVLFLKMNTGVDKSTVLRFKRLSQPDRLERLTELSLKRHDKKTVTIKQVFLLKTH